MCMTTPYQILILFRESHLSLAAMEINYSLFSDWVLDWESVACHSYMFVDVASWIVIHLYTWDIIIQYCHNYWITIIVYYIRQSVKNHVSLFFLQLLWSYSLPAQRRYSSIRTCTCTSVDPASTCSTPDSQTVTCWKCGRQISMIKEKKVSFFCPCEERVILPPSVTNYFTILEWWVTPLDLH